MTDSRGQPFDVVEVHRGHEIRRNAAGLFGTSGWAFDGEYPYLSANGARAAIDVLEDYLERVARQ